MLKRRLILKLQINKDIYLKKKARIDALRSISSRNWGSTSKKQSFRDTLGYIGMLGMLAIPGLRTQRQKTIKLRPTWTKKKSGSLKIAWVA